MSSSPVIRISGLAKRYRTYERPADRLLELLNPFRPRGVDFQALQGIDLTVRAGESVAIVGYNGSGKSTLLQLVCGLTQPSAGDVTVRGRVAGLLELGAGFNPDFTGRENVHLTATILGLHKHEIAARFDTIEAFAGIGPFMDRPVQEYSSGMQARLGFAVCAHVNPDILVIDEALAVGDASFQRQCVRYLRKFQEDGGTLLFVSHDEHAVLDLCKRAVWLDKGRLLADGPSEEVCKRYAQAQRERSSQAHRVDEPWAVMAPPPSVRDLRWHNANPIEVLDFDPDAPWHGEGGAEIEDVGLFAPDGSPLSTTHGGDEVELHISCRAVRQLARPIVGFILRNERAENLAGDNTYLRYRDTPFDLAAGETFTARFRFQLPYLPMGLYHFAPSIIEGTQHDHVHLHWMENALTLRVMESPIRRGAIGVAMLDIGVN
jgi:lipopolysaccharide transport system ATP-binding protein